MDFASIIEKIKVNPFVLEFPAETSNTQQWLIVRGVGLALVALIVWKFILPMFTGPLRDRREAIATASEQVEETTRETKLLRDDYRLRLEKIEDETEARLAEAVREADDLKRHIIDEARQTAEAIVARGESEVGRERDKAMVGLRKQFVEDVIGAAEHVAARMDTKHQGRLFDLFVQNVGAKS